MSKQASRLRVALIVPTYPSRRCGISTYSTFLRDSLRPLADVEVVTASQGGAPGLITRALAAARGADIVHVQHAFDIYGYMGVQTFPLALALSRAKAALISTIHELPGPAGGSLKDRLAAPYLRLCILTLAACSDAVVVHTRPSLEQLALWGGAGRARLIPHGAVGALPTVPAAPVGLGRTVGFFGFLNEAKGVHRLIEALSLLPDVRLIIAGEPRTERDRAYERELHARAAHLGLAGRITFAPFVPDEKLPAFFASIDVAIFPYTHCTASGALHIALAQGAAVLASDLPVFQELKREHGCLETFALDETNSLAAQIAMLLGDKRRRLALSAAAREAAGAASWENVAQAHLELYNELRPSHSSSARGPLSATGTGG